MNSIRQQLLPSDVRDAIAYWFTVGTVQGFLPCNAVEVRLDDPLRHILEGGEGFCSHALSQSERYFTHRDDEQWAVVLNHDCSGDVERGKRIVNMWMAERHGSN